MDFKTAAATRMPFGKYQGETLDAIARSDDGLRYLDWLRGMTWVKANLAGALAAYLEDPAIAEDVTRVVKRG